MFDARVDGQSPSRGARAAQVTAAVAESRRQVAEVAAAVAELKRTMPGVEVKISGFTGGPSEVTNRSAALTAAAPGAGSEAIVREFLGEHGAIYGLSAADLGDLVALGDSPGGPSGLRMLRMEQQIDGRPVFQSETRFLLDREGRLVKSVGRMVPHARAAVSRAKSARTLTAAEAISHLVASAGKESSPAQFTVTEENAEGWTQLEGQNDYVKGTMSARQVLFPLAPGMLVDAWSVVVFTAGKQDWYAVVDAETGGILWRKNIRNYASAHDARFRVYVQADGVTPAESPAPQSPSTVAPGSGVQPPEIAPTIVSMHTAMDPTASPNGWINDCTTATCTAAESQTLGNNVLVCLDRDGTGNNVCDTGANSVVDGNGRPTGNPDANGRNRDFLGTAPRDFQTNFLPPPQGGNPEAGQTVTGNGAAQTIFRRGAMTHMFYAANWYHDKLYALGFDEAAGNFQVTNFSGMGLGNDRINVDAQDASDTDNAQFGTPPDGVSGRAEMFRFTGPTIDRDGGLDAAIFLHELSHGTSNRLVGNAAGLNWDSAGGMGEGWSDFIALALLNSTATDTATGNYPASSYSTYKIAGLPFTDNYVYGIRRFPYTDNNSVNPMTWADVDDVTNNLSGGIAPTTVPFDAGGGAEVHNSGEIWALTLWELRSRLITAAGSVAAGNQTALQLVIDGLKLTPIDPLFTEARDSILDADCATHACANEELIWGSFADRGLGWGAKQPFRASFGFIASHLGIKESFQSPFLDVVNPGTDVTLDDSIGNNNGGIDPGEPVRLTVRLTNPWRAAGKAVASATATLTSSTPGVTILDGTSTYGAIAPQGSATGDTFTIALSPSALCGSPINFTVTTTSSLGTTSTTFQLRVGAASGTDAAVTYTGDPNPNLAIPDADGRGVKHQINITDDFVIADLNLRIDSITHTFADDLMFALRSPGGLMVDHLAFVGFNTADGGNGDNLTNTVIDDDLPFDDAHDMITKAAASAPYPGPFVPVFNSPSWPVIFGPDADPVGNLSYYDGQSTLGTWTALAADEFGGDTGTLNAWSMIVTPVHFACTPFAAVAEVSATKTVSGTFRVGGTVTYTVTLTNNGTSAQNDNTGDEFSDTLPAGLTLVSATATSGTAATAGNTATWNGSLAPLGGSVTITITATVNPGTQGSTISNQGTVSYDSNADNSNDATAPTDDPGAGGTADPTTFAVGTASVSTTKTVSGTFTVGGTVTYTIVLTNSGTDATLDNAGNELTDTLPASLTLVSATATGGTATTGGNTVNWNGSVPAAGSVTLTITATINSGAQGTTISNQATTSFDNDLNGTNETSGVSDDPGVGGAADPTSFAVGSAAVTATKTVSGTFTQGGTVTYTIVLSNSGSSATLDNAGNELTDTLPASLTLVSATATGGAATTAGNTVNWNGSIPAAGSVTITITATINSGTQGSTISNQASISYDADLNGSNETTGVSDDPGAGGAADPTTFSVGGASLTAAKTVSGTFSEGGTVTYTIVLTNSGPSATPDNAGNELTDVLPSSLTLVSASATGGTATATIATNTVTWTGSVPASGSVTITITATINAGTTGTVSNQANYTYDADLNGSNESTGTSDAPGGGANDPTTFVVGGAVTPEVPTVSEVGLVLLGLGLLFAAWTVLRRRRTV